MIDHVTVGVSHFERSRAFYDRVLQAIGIERLYSEGRTFAGYGAGEKAFFWIGLRTAAITGVHIAFAVTDRRLVHRFHEAALSAGGRDNGMPGVRPHYHRHYYGAFFFDPDGHNIEAVCHSAV